MQWTNFSVSSASAPLSSQQPSLHHLVNQGPTTPQPLPAVMGTPNFLGLSLREAVRMAERNGWRVATRGSGYVMHQTVTDDPHSKELVYVLTLAPAGETPS